MAVLKRAGSDGGYAIVSEDEFFEAFPEGAQRTRAELTRALDILAAEGYIDMRYSGGGLFCLSALKSAPDPVVCADEPQSDAVEAAPKPRGISAFWAAFLGGAAGSFIVSLIFAFF